MAVDDPPATQVCPQQETSVSPAEGPQLTRPWRRDCVALEVVVTARVVGVTWVCDAAILTAVRPAAQPSRDRQHSVAAKVAAEAFRRPTPNGRLSLALACKATSYSIGYV